jgi:hypothetical protein
LPDPTDRECTAANHCQVTLRPFFVGEETMSIAAITSSSIFQELKSFFQNRSADVKQLGSALQSGDLNGAQQAFNALAALGQNGPFASSEPFSKSSRAQSFEAIGQALQSGDLAGAQAAFAALTARPSPQESTPAAVVNISGAQPSPTTATDNPSSIYQQLQAFRQQRQSDLAQLGQALQSGDLAGAQTAFDTLTALGQAGPNKDGQTFARSDRNQDFQAIGQALQSGDLAGAQAAFAALKSSFGGQNQVGQNQQAQNAISAYSPAVTEIVINFTAGTDGTPATSGVAVGAPSPAIEPPVTQNQTTGSVAGGTPEIVINLGGETGLSTASAPAAEIVINLGKSNEANSASTNGYSLARGEEVTIDLSGFSSAEVSIGAPQGQGNTNEQLTLNLNQQSNYELIVNLFNGAASQGNGNAVSLQA